MKIDDYLGLFGGLFGDLAWVIWGYLGVWRELSRVIFPTSWNVLGNPDDNNRSGDTARYAGGGTKLGTKSVSIIIETDLQQARMSQF